MVAKNKYTLKVGAEDGRARVIGLVSDASDYKLSWHLNQHLKIKLTKSADFIWSSKQMQQRQEFSCYSYIMPSENQIKLIRNLSSSGIPISPYHQFDYLVILQDGFAPNLADSILNQLKLSKLIRAVYPLDPSPILDWLG